MGGAGETEDCFGLATGGSDALSRHAWAARATYGTESERVNASLVYLYNRFRPTFVVSAGGRFPGGRIAMHADADAPRSAGEETTLVPDGVLTIGKLDPVFKSGKATRDTIPSHLLVGRDITGEVADFYGHVCPAGVYERVGDELRVNPPNCIDCKATDLLGPRWTPREGGSGPRYRVM